MNFFWDKKGLIYKPDGSVEWMKSHAQGPCPIIWEGKLRTFFAIRPSTNSSLPTFIDLNIDNPKEILYLHKTPILELGGPGTFDEHGIMPHPPVNVDGKIYLYYVGWSRRANTPYALALGLAISEDGINFQKYSEGPVMGVEHHDALTVTAPYIIHHNGQFYMYYTAGLKWFMLNGRWEHTYTVRMATSPDGINWSRDFVDILKQKDEYECMSCPTILHIDNEFHMWYSYKGSLDFRQGADSYRIGYATSTDLINWERKDAHAGIDVSPDKEEWDSHMVEYPTTIQVGDKYYLFYNGNGFSETGFGYAELVINK